MYSGLQMDVFGNMCIVIQLIKKNWTRSIPWEINISNVKLNNYISYKKKKKNQISSSLSK